jgi:high-affinity Fe2+/Pb2+ permease
MKRFSKVAVTLTSVVLAGLACFEGFVIYWYIHSPDSQTRELFALAGLVVFISTMLVMAGMWLHYLEIRWLYIPYWRWMTGGFKGRPDTPLARFLITREQIAEAKQKMSRSQHVWMWVGNVCGGLGVILLGIAVFWRLVLAITFKETIGSTANMLFLIGFLISISGFGIVRICIGKTEN